jgi:phosphoglycerol transferase MdoB-like AlkP superfamily enzyme
MPATHTFHRDERPPYRRFLDALAVPRVARLAFVVVAIDVVVFSLMRAIFYFYFRRPEDPVSAGVLLKSFYIGLKFDIRLALFMALPLLVLGALPRAGVFRGWPGRLVFTAYLVFVHFIAFIVYAFDFGHYAYLEERLNITALRFLANLGISAEMIWQTYPVLWIGAGLLLFVLAILVLFSVLIGRGVRYMPAPRGRLMRLASGIVVAALVMAGAWGKFSRYPLRWSDAYFNPHKFSSEVALNPVLYLGETWGLQTEPHDIDMARAYYPDIAGYLGVDYPDAEALDYSRVSRGPGAIGGNPNVVVVILESFAFYKTGVLGNPLDPTPNFDRLAREGLLFRRFYTPSSGTARSVWAFITGLPDVESRETSSRNPLIVKQRSIIEAFEGYEKLYFLGGSANWANIRGLLSSNIEGLEIFEEGSYSSKVEDVWGIPDLHMFEEANRVLAGKKAPFFAIIQTSGNHRPYTIPKDNRGFELVDPGSQEKVKRYGFESINEFNSFRFLDHGIGHFIAQASREDYFGNTVFVFFGDHGLPGNSPTMFKSEQQLALTTFHVPLVIYAPGLIDGGAEYETVASELDVLPTIASLVSKPYLNTALGRDLLDSSINHGRYAFTIVGQGRTPEIGMVSEDFYFRTFVDDGKGTLHDYYSDSPREDVSAAYPEVAARMERMARAYYESARYIRYHNAPAR